MGGQPSSTLRSTLLTGVQGGSLLLSALDWMGVASGKADGSGGGMSRPAASSLANLMLPCDAPTLPTLCPPGGSVVALGLLSTVGALGTFGRDRMVFFRESAAGGWVSSGGCDVLAMPRVSAAFLRLMP